MVVTCLSLFSREVVIHFVISAIIGTIDLDSKLRSHVKRAVELL